MSNYEVNINRKKLEKACRSLFDAGLLEVRMKYDKDENGERIDKNVLVNSFMDVVDEIVKVGKREDLPVLAVEIYNEIVEQQPEMETESIGKNSIIEKEIVNKSEEITISEKIVEEKIVEEKIVEEKIVEEKIVEIEKTKVKDEFGYKIGTKANLFAQAIKNKPMTMKEVRWLNWNEGNRQYYGYFRQLVKMNIAYKDEEDKMHIK